AKFLFTAPKKSFAAERSKPFPVNQSERKFTVQVLIFFKSMIKLNIGVAKTAFLQLLSEESQQNVNRRK
ncbi:MAG: hypothetical protein MJ085_05330, partial [Clostridia bacterium]|nr:hypothetical protein [Clostridia bacterium]